VTVTVGTEAEEVGNIAVGYAGSGSGQEMRVPSLTISSSSETGGKKEGGQISSTRPLGLTWSRLSRA